MDGFPARFATDHGRALLAYLAVEADRPHSRAYLAFLFWPEHPEAHALNNLRQTLIRLRQALAVDDRSASPLDITSKTIQFNSAAATLDVRRFQQWLAQCNAHAHHSLEQCAECMQTLEQATTLYKGEFLQGISLRHSQPFTEWAVYVREELHHQMLSVLQTLATYFEEQGDYGRARAFVARQLTLEPWREEAHYQMMRVLAKGGQRSAAILQYETCKNVLFEELGIAPSSEITLLYERLKADTFARVGDAMSGTGGQRGLSSIGTPTHSRWGDLPAISRLYGRQSELAQLEKWLIEEQSRLVMVLGMGGIGKTTLTTSAVETTARYYEIVLWRSLVNAPTLNEILNDWLGILSAENLAELPQALDAQLALLMQHLRQHRCLLILDNLETLFSAEQAGQMRPDYADYEQLFQQVAEMHHQSCLVLTSREQLHSIAHFNDDLPWVRTLWLEGLNANAAQTLLISRDLTVQNSQAAALAGLYSGNPLALKLVAETIQELFDGHVDEFLASEGVIFDDIRSVLDQQFGRLPVLEQMILFWLAIEREPLSFELLRDNVAPTHPAPEIIAALRALQRRSLLQRTIRNQSTNGLVASIGFWAETRFTVPNVVTEYLIDRLVQAVCHEIEAAKPDWLHSYCLMQAQAKEYVRQTQVRLILQPVASYVEARLGRKGVRRRVMAMLDALRAEPFLPRSYVVGNLLNLLIFLDVDLRGLDLAGFAVWQSDLRHANLANVNLAGADLTRSRFVDAFGFVLTVAVSPDGTRVAAGTNSGEVRLWDAVSGHLLHVYKGHRKAVRSIAFRPDGKTLASSSEDHQVRLWSVEVATRPGSPPELRPELSTESSTDSSTESPTMIAPMARILDGHAGRVLSVAFHPNGNMLATASSDQTVRLWDVVSGETRAVLTEHEQPVWAVAFSPDGRTLASSDTSGAICLWDSQTGELGTTLRGHTMIVRSLAFDPKSRWLASGSHDHTVCLWNVATGEIEHTLAAATDVVTSVAFSPDGSLLAVGGDDQFIRLWETDRLTDSLTPVHQLFGHNDAICALAFSADGQTLVSGGVDHIVCLWDLHRARIRRILSGYSQHINALAFHPDGKRLASGHYDHCVRVWDVDKRVLMQTLQGHSLSVNSVAFGRDGAFLASGSDDKRIMVWTMPAPLITGAEAGEIRRLYQLRGHQREVTGVEFSADGKRLLSSSEDQTLGVWDLETGESRYFQIADEVPIFSVKSNATGTLIATLTNHTIRLWDGEEGELTKELQGHSDFIWSLAFSSDGHWLASGGSDGSIGLWDVRNPAQAHLVTTLHGHAERLFCVAFSPDAKWIASAGADHTICLWEIESQQKIRTFTGHTQWVSALAFSPDGRLLASGGLDETIRLWHLEQGAPLALLPSPGPYAGMNISGVTGISDAERTILKQLGAVEE